MFNKKIKTSSKISLSIIFIIISLPLLYNAIFGIITQLTSGYEIVESQGFDLSYNLINTSYFNFSIDVIVLLLGFLIFIKIYSKKSIFMSLIIVTILGFLVSYIERFGSKQNRFILYIYVILCLFSIIFLDYYKNKISKIIIILFISVIIIINVIQFNDYKGYRPINSDNLNFIEENIDKINLQNNLSCGRSAFVALLYSHPSIHCSEIKNEFDLKNSSILLFADDLIFYNSFFPEIDKKIKNIIDQENYFYDQKSRSYIIFSNVTAS